MKPWMWLALAAGGYYLYTKRAVVETVVAPENVVPSGTQEGDYEGEPADSVMQDVIDAAGGVYDTIKNLWD